MKAWIAVILIVVVGNILLAFAEGPNGSGDATTREATASTELLATTVPLASTNPVDGGFIHVRLILETRCLNCHGGAKVESGLEVSTRDLLLKGGDVDGPAIVPGHPEKSPLYQQITHKEDPGMPKDESKLPDEIIDEFKQWIIAGAPLDGKLTPVAAVANRNSDWPMFHPVVRPEVPTVKNTAWVRNPIDAFVAHEQEAHGLKPRPEASKRMLLRRVYIDLIGLPPTPEEIQAFEADKSPDAYEKVVDSLLADPRYGERWGRHWLDIWRYSDNYQIGFSSVWGGAHAWRWRDWVIDNINKNTGYDQMVLLMLAGDEAAPGDPDALAATGFMVRNVSSDKPEQQQAMVEHTGKAFLGITMNCCRCHDHKFDPFSQKEYYGMCSIFAPAGQHPVPIPGKANVKLDAIDQVYDVKPTEMAKLNDAPMPPCVPACLGGGALDVKPVALPLSAINPMRQPYAITDALNASAQEVDAARNAVTDAKPELVEETKAELAAAQARDASLKAVLKVEGLEDAGKKNSTEWTVAANAATQAQREEAVAADEADVAKKRVELAKIQKTAPAAAVVSTPASTKPGAAAGSRAEQEIAAAVDRLSASEKALATAQEKLNAPADPKFKPRENITAYPAQSSGRRLALAHWIIDKKNPLTARVAVNDIWLRHFGAALQANVTDFGHRAMPASNLNLLNWLAAEFMDDNWDMKKLHRLIVTSATYREDSQYDDDDARIDSENVYLWRMNSQRMEAEVVRDSVLYMSSTLEAGSPRKYLKVDNKIVDDYRRSIYYPISQNSIMPFLAVFDGPDVNSCYQRACNVSPQQALLMANGKLVYDQSQIIAQRLSAQVGVEGTPENNAKFIAAAFDLILNEQPNDAEKALCTKYLTDRAAYLAAGKGASLKGQKNPATPAQRAREDLVHVLFSHNDFLTVR